jgi:hypothetical protein
MGAVGPRDTSAHPGYHVGYQHQPDLAPAHPKQRKTRTPTRVLQGVSEGTRTPDRRDHNPELYQLSYAHQAGLGV